MESKLEQLLNSLLKKGWLPRWRKKTLHITIYDCDLNVYLDWWFMNEDKKSFRELVSKESNLWQFVCENDYWAHKDTYFVEKYTDHIAKHLYQCNDYRYWLLGSALKDESELEDFLLNSIKIWNED